MQQNDTQHEMYKQIYNMIIEDNARSGIHPTGHRSTSRPSSSSSDTNRQLTNGHARPLSMPETPTKSQAADELFLPPQQQTLQTAAVSQPPVNQSSIPRRERPIIPPKSQVLRAHSKTRDEARPLQSDELAERFSQLRVQRQNPERLQNGHQDIPSASNYTPSSLEASPSLVNRPQSMYGTLPATPKPSGPREQPPSRQPPPPPKIPLDAKAEVQLPKAPSPAYNPSKSVVPPIKTGMPTLHRKASIIGTDPVSPQSAKRFSGHISLTNGYPHSPTSDDGDRSVSYRKPVLTKTRPHKSISADELYSRLKAPNVLLIDVRNRKEFDEGHIMAQSIMCIEPLGLKPGLSAEQLEERLIVSPESEQKLFDCRDEFDLVVYYDQRTQSDRFLTGPPTRTEADALRNLHDTLYEFNEYKPLRRPPLLLRGGLDAWIDLVGPQALAASSTAALVSSTSSRRQLGKPGRPIGRVPVASANSSLAVQRRRLRDQKPLNADEERTWLEKVRREQVDLADYQNAQSDGDGDSNNEEPPSPFFHTYEDFLRRYPAVPIVQQSMMATLPTAPSPRAPPPAFDGPGGLTSSPANQPLPSVPSRPPPAVPRPSYSGVSERESTQFSPSSRQSSSAQHPLYTSRSIIRYMKLPRTGLINFSVTCYLNATIQCLVATIPLSQFFLDNKWRDLTQKNWKGSNGIMPEIYANLIRSLWRDDVNAVRPTSLRNFCARLNREWGVDRQQDAKEFFDFLIDCLHEDLNTNWQRTPLNPLTPREEMQRERIPIQQASNIEWSRYTHREKSYISDLFAGQHASRLRCTTCGNTSTTYEAFYSISVEIPRHSGKRPWTIDDCLRSYCQEEKLSGEEVWKCPYCNCEREATKRITITRAPQFLVVHFKRFEMRKGESARKVHTPISFPLFGLNMEPYMIPQAPKMAQDTRAFEEPTEPATMPPYLYDAYAVMRHIGSSGNGGHYISLVRDAARNNIWRKFDDERVNDFDPNKLKPAQSLQNEQAYLVFYGRTVAR